MAFNRTNEKETHMDKILDKLNLNWSAVWRKAVVGGVAAALMGATYRANKQMDEALDERYPKPRPDED